MRPSLVGTVVLAGLGLALSVLPGAPRRDLALASSETPMSVVRSAETLPNQYAVVGLWNNTNKQITYHFRWGNRPWKEWTIQPGERRWQAYSFPTPNQTVWPAPYLRYDIDGRTGSATWVTVELHANAAPLRGYWYGNRYAFVLRADGYTINVVRIFDDPGPRLR